MSEVTNTNSESWVSKLDQEISNWEYLDGMDPEMHNILRDLLLSNGNITATTTAHRIGGYYEELMKEDPLMKYEADKGFTSFLKMFYYVYFTVAEILPYNNSTKHDDLVQLILELRRLPPRKVTIWRRECLVWGEERVFGDVLWEHWRWGFPFYLEKRDKGVVSYEEECDRWLNVSTHFAHQIRAGLVDYWTEKFDIPIDDISTGLEKELPEPERYYRAMAAAQYILLLGGKIGDCCFDLVGADRLEPERWKRWIEAFAKISSDKENKDDLREAAGKAHSFMVSCHPELL
ncbi:MAG: hypothetical protein M1840_006089 [Geoglossum simile]|nr:MAG: hypothetical protein M1840_006089 [Geoglossum simile]